MTSPPMFQMGFAYARALAAMHGSDWFELNERLGATGYADVASLVLIHPAWYGGDGIAGTCPYRGTRDFRMQRPLAGTPCAAVELWGYDCPFDDHHLQPDHRFPFSLGGPTEPSNAIWLCRIHNQAKSGDWHLETRRPDQLEWFPPLLKRVSESVAHARSRELE